MSPDADMKYKAPSFPRFTFSFVIPLQLEVPLSVMVIFSMAPSMETVLMDSYK